MNATDRLTAVDLSDLSEEEHSALRQEAIKEGLSFSKYLSRLVAKTSTRLLEGVTGSGAGPIKQG